MVLFAAGLPISAFGVMADDLWTAVAFISIATSCHQAWSANIGGMLMLLVAGGMLQWLQWLGSFKPLFIFAGVMHPLAWIAIRALVGKNIRQIDLDKGLRTAQSPALFAMGLGLMAVGATLAALVFANWSYILSVTKSSVAAAAGGAAAASLLALMGLALVYASREVRLGAARSAA